MKITPIEIRQKSFEKTFRGFEKDDVNAFLLSLSKEWERIQEENKHLNFRLENSQKEVEKLREVESSLFKTLKTAEDTGANMIEQANKSAELHMKESQMKSEALMNEAKNRARAIIEKAEADAREIIDGMQDEVKGLEQVYKEFEKYRDNLISELKNLSNDTFERVEKLQKQTKYQGIDSYLKQSKELSRDRKQIQSEPQAINSVAPEKPVSQGDSVDEPAEPETSQEDQTSFFNQIGK